MCNNFNNVYYIMTLSVLPAHLERDKKGRFKGKQIPLVPLPLKLTEALIGDLLGDGCIRFNKKLASGTPKPNTNAQFAMTLKSKEYVTYL